MLGELIILGLLPLILLRKIRKFVKKASLYNKINNKLK